MSDDVIRVWDRLDRRTRAGLFPHATSSGVEEEPGIDYLISGRSKIDIYGFWKRSEDLRCRHGEPMRDMDFTRWNRAIDNAKRRHHHEP